MDGAGEASSYGVNLTTGRRPSPTRRSSASPPASPSTAASTASGIAISRRHHCRGHLRHLAGKRQRPDVSGLDVTGGTGTGIDLAQSSRRRRRRSDRARIRPRYRHRHHERCAGPAITDAVIDGSSREGIALGATSGARVDGCHASPGTGASQSTGILTLLSTGVVIDHPIITEVMYGITTSATNTGVGPQHHRHRRSRPSAGSPSAPRRARSSRAPFSTAAPGQAVPASTPSTRAASRSPTRPPQDSSTRSPPSPPSIRPRTGWTSPSPTSR